MSLCVFTVQSQEPLARMVPLGLKATHDTAFECPSTLHPASTWRERAKVQSQPFRALVGASIGQSMD